ncbi:hypothetical protein E2493_16660 [Sphingomonas parva]|uniref:Uncharacterized protein n=1 Tax=Sphingomonas parva TaxID=2555898 RepID=A0A4Y8ZMC5_9SPHN|nr:relaxase/mobilization nuclease domain-containing protein [Sphingomonas parva]TFI57140.1 hypothetical protein E2493_16660 [Sphingomonas parva]
MIIKRIRKGQMRRRGTILRLAESVIVLSCYLVDAEPERLIESAHVRAMSNYVVDAKLMDELGISPGEKVEAFGALNLEGDRFEDWQIDMLAVSARCPRSHFPLDHWVLSWKAHEQPTREQAEESVGIFAEVMGIQECQMLWSLHTNTENWHLHILGNRVHPITGKMVQAGDGWDKDRMAQARAIIEERQGWEPEPGAKFVARSGAVYDVESGALLRTADGTQAPRNRRDNLGSLPGFDPALRERIVSSITEASDWHDLHARLRPLGVRYDRKGSGATITVGDDTHPASRFGRECSRTAVEARLGPFRPDPQRANAAFESYRQACRNELDRIRAAQAAELARLDDHLAAILSDIDPALPGFVAAAMGAAMRAEVASAKGAITTAFATTKDGFAKSRLGLEAWLTAGQPSAPAATMLPSIMLPGANVRGVSGAVPSSTTSLHHARDGWTTLYLDVDGRVVIEDHRCVIVVMNGDPKNIAIALEMAAARWKTVRVSGSSEYVRLSTELAAERGIVLVDHAGRRLLPEPKPAAVARAGVHRKPLAPVADAGPLPQRDPNWENVAAVSPHSLVPPSHEPEEDGPSVVDQASHLQRKGKAR